MNSITFDSTEILNATYIPRFVRHESSPARELALLEAAKEDGAVLVSERYGVKYITISGKLTAASRSALDTAIDNFKELFSRKEKQLDIDWAGSTRRYVATCQRHTFDRDHFHNLFVPWSAEFVVVKGSGQDTSLTAVKDAIAITSLSSTTPYTTEITLAGSAEPKPIFTLLFGSGWSNAFGIMVENTDRDEKMVIVNYDDAGDPLVFASPYALVINCEEKTVKYDGADVPFYGIFPFFQIGTNNIKIQAGDIIDQQFVPGAVGQGDVLTVQASTVYKAQSFSVPYTDKSYQGLLLYLRKKGSPPNDLTIEIQTDDGGEPSGSVVPDATFTITAASLSTSLAWKMVNSTNKFALTANTKYWIVCKTIDGSSSHRYELGNSIRKYATYKRGIVAGSTNGGSTWNVPNSIINTDLGFKLLYGGKADSSPNLTLDADYYKRWL